MFPNHAVYTFIGCIRVWMNQRRSLQIGQQWTPAWTLRLILRALALLYTGEYKMRKWKENEPRLKCLDEDQNVVYWDILWD